MNPYTVVEELEKRIAEFFGAPFAVATDSCTSALELCLRFTQANYIRVPRNTYLSVPMLAEKLKIELHWDREGWAWEDQYCIGDNIWDSAVLWKEGGYLKGQMQCLSFQHQKHLKIGRAGIILLDNQQHAILLKKMSYDGREPNFPWREQNICSWGIHAYCQPELAQVGLDKLDEAIKTEPRKWNALKDWPDLTKLDIFKDTI